MMVALRVASPGKRPDHGHPGSNGMVIVITRAAVILASYLMILLDIPMGIVA